jgi:hypothetical protein
VVDHWFAHPSENRGEWQGPLMAALKAQDAKGAVLRAELARRTARLPSDQAPNDQAHDQHHPHPRPRPADGARGEHADHDEHAEHGEEHDRAA